MAATWVNIPASNSLKNEFNEGFPARSTASDGTIGDPAHAETSSNHNPDETGRTPREDSDTINEVHARDVDKDLNKSGWTMSRAVGIILERCRSGAEKRLYEIIWDRHIYTETYDWRERDYDGPNPHTEHAHFSFKYGSGSGTSNPENITSPWGILAAIEAEEDVPLTPADANLIIDTMGARLYANSPSDQFVSQMKAVVWRYTGGGLQGATTSLDALSDTQPLQGMITDLAALIQGQTQASAEEIAALVLAGLPESALTEEDVVAAVKQALREGTQSAT